MLYEVITVAERLAEEVCRYLEAEVPRITSYNVCYTKLLRDFGTRMSGTGPFAQLIAQRFHLAARRLGLAEPPPLAVHHFRPPSPGGQLGLF